MLYRQHDQTFLSSNNTAVTAREKENTTGITEIVLPNEQSLEVVLPSLAFLSRNLCPKNKNRWLTWFPPIGVTKELLTGYGFDLSRVRFVYPKDTEHCFWLFWEALAEGNSHTVIASPGKLTEQQVKRLEHASAVGDCSGLLLRNR